jgi:peptide/nickel transport system permease protein
MRLNYLLTRFAFLLLVLWSAATINFFLPRLSGQDPIRERQIKQMLLGASIQAGF